LTIIRVGIQITQQHATYPQIRQAWRAVDASGADSLFNWDHFFPLSGDPNGAHLDKTVAQLACHNLSTGCYVRI
jgi:hypothetical protein